MKTIIEQAKIAAAIDYEEGAGPIITGRPSQDELRECCRIFEASKVKQAMFSWEDESYNGLTLPEIRILRTKSNVENLGWLINPPAMGMLPSGKSLVTQSIVLGVWNPEYYEFID